MKIALIYDRVNKWGGAESVLLTLHEMFPEAPLYTSIYNPSTAPWAKVFPKVIPSFLQKIPILNNNHELLGAFSPIGYEQFNFDDYDLVISVTSEAAKGIITKPKTLHICYCLTPTRYLWSGYQEYLNNPPKSLDWIPFYKLVSQPFLRYTKYWDKVAGQKPDRFVAISTEVKTRIRKYYNRDSEIVFPPVDLDFFRTGRSATPLSSSGVISGDFGENGYFLVVARLVPYKKVDLAIEAFNELDLPLVIVGTGSEEKRLKFKSKRNIHFTGFVSDKELAVYYQNAKALIMPQEEDFGIVAVEAQAAGCPVIAYNKGGAMDTVIDGETGVLFGKQTVEDLKNAVTRFGTLQFEKSKLVRNAERFSKDRFKKEFLDLVKKFV